MSELFKCQKTTFEESLQIKNIFYMFSYSPLIYIVKTAGNIVYLCIFKETLLKAWLFA